MKFLYIFLIFIFIGCNQPREVIDASKYPFVALNQTNLQTIMTKIQNDFGSTNLFSRTKNTLDIRQVADPNSYQNILKGDKANFWGVVFSFYNQNKQTIILANPYVISQNNTKFSLLNDKETFKIVDDYLKNLK